MESEAFPLSTLKQEPTFDRFQITIMQEALSPKGKLLVKALKTMLVYCVTWSDPSRDPRIEALVLSLWCWEVVGLQEVGRA